MALQHITPEQIAAYGVVSAPDVLNGTTAQNKAVFDKLIATIVAPAYNACVDAVAEKYEKPSDGIPETDLDSSVQQALAKAKAAVSSKYVDSVVALVKFFIDEDIDEIKVKIPTSASSTNKLVSASQMGDAISSVEAKQLYATASQGSFSTKAALTGATAYYNADGTIATPTKNDVAYVLADESHSGKSAKYVIADVVDDVITWGFVITFSDTTFTQAQIDAINSGATAENIAAIAGKYEKPSDGIPKSDLDPSVQASLDTEIFEIVYGETKVSDIVQAINAGKLPVCFTTEGPEGLVDFPASKYAYVYTNYGARMSPSWIAEVETIYLRGRRGKGRHSERRMRIEKTSVFNPDTRRSEESAVYSISLVPTIPSGTRHLYANAQQGLFSTEDALDEASTFYNEEGNVTTPQVNDVTYVWFSDKLYVITQIIEGVITWSAVKTFSDATFTQAQMEAINSGANAENIAAIAEKYVKPTGGIPDTDLAQSVQESLSNADTALQEVPIASEETLGGIKAGSDFDISADGTLSLYKTLTLSASVSPSSAEKGSTIDKVTVNWTLNKMPVSQSVDGVDVPVSARSKVLTDLGITDSRTFNVTAADARMSLTRNPGITFYRYVYSKVGSPDSAPTQASECVKQSDLSTFGNNGANFNYTAGDTLWLLTTKANAQIQTNVLGQWADVTTIYGGTVEFAQANGAVATYYAYNTGTFSGTGSAKYRIS